MTQLAPPRETSQQRWERKSKNALTRSVGFLEKSVYLARANLIEADIQARKKQFGMKYMDLIENGGTEQQLARCAEASRMELDALEAKALHFREKAMGAEDATKNRLIRKPKRDPSEHWNNPAPPSTSQNGCFDDDCTPPPPPPLPRYHSAPAPSPSAPVDPGLHQPAMQNETAESQHHVPTGYVYATAAVVQPTAPPAYFDTN